jgi:hypothetical protein
MKQISLALALMASSFAATRVTLKVEAPEKWDRAILNQLIDRIGKINGVELVRSGSETDFVVELKVSEVRMKNGDLVGYSAASMVYGVYDERILRTVFQSLQEEQAIASYRPLMKAGEYTAKANRFVVDFFLQHGPLEDFGTEVSDRILAVVREKAVPEHQKAMQVLREALAQSRENDVPLRPEGSRASLPRGRY